MSVKKNPNTEITIEGKYIKEPKRHKEPVKSPNTEVNAWKQYLNR